MTSALSVGNTILKRACNDRADMTPMKLQKMIYIVYKEYLKRTGRSLFPERFEVWKYGPVVRDVYDAFKKYGTNVIKKFYIDCDGYIHTVNKDSSPIFYQILDNVWNKYSPYSGIRLSEMTCKKDTAWYKAAKRDDIFLNDKEIQNEGDFI